MEGVKKNLKSNMDRFIAIHYNSEIYDYMYLKSNMDRFIDMVLLCISLFH